MESGSPCRAASVTSGPVSCVGVAPADLRQVGAPPASAATTSSRASRTRALPGGVLLPAAAVAARAAVPVGHDLHVPELAGHAVGAAEDPAVDDDRAADAGAERDAQDEPVPGAGAEPALAERGGVGVVVDHDRDGDPARQRGPAAARRARPGAARTSRSTGWRRRSRRRRCRPRRRRSRCCSSWTSSTMVSSTPTTSCAGVGRRRQLDARCRSSRRRRPGPWCRRCRCRWSAGPTG